MDQSLLYFFNHTLATPALDVIMFVITLIAPFVYPAVGFALLVSPKARRTGWAILFTTALCLGITLAFQFLVLRPRPIETIADLRIILAPPNFPSYPSGHASCAFAFAVLVGLRRRKAWYWGLGLLAASIIALSRIYLGMHYPSDIVAGAILGIGTGAVGYGLILAPRISPRQTLQWLFFLQLAIILLGTHMAYLDILPWRYMRWPMADKVLHMLVLGGISFWLNLWLNGRAVRVWKWHLPVAVILPFGLALIEECLQSLSPVRTFDLLDLTADLLGMTLMYVFSNLVLVRMNLLKPAN